MKKLHWQQIPATEITQIFCANSDFDGIVLDDEHGSFSERDLFTLIQLINAHGKESYVRFAELDKGRVRKVLDAGVHGVIFSTVNSLQDLEKMIWWCSYPPTGFRGQGLVAENKWGGDASKLQNRDPVIIAQIEDRRGIDLLPTILLTKPKVDYYLIGPYDLSASVGVCGDWEHPEFLKAIDKFNKEIPDEKKAIHLVTDIENQLPKYVDYGVVAVGMDTLAITENITNNDKILQKQSNPDSTK